MRHGDGSPVEKLSFAFTEVQNFHLSIMREAAERFDIDGVNMAFVRLNQALGETEQPLLDAYQAQYGDAHRTDEKIKKSRRDSLFSSCVMPAKSWIRLAKRKVNGWNCQPGSGIGKVAAPLIHPSLTLTTGR